MKNRKMSIWPILALVIVIVLHSTAVAATFQLSGCVTDQSGNPIAATLVEVIDPATGATVASATTGAEGIYALSIDEGTYDIRVTPPVESGFSEFVSPEQVINGDTTLDFVLVPAGLITVSGRVVDRDGVPIPNVAVVELEGTGGDETNTDALGNFSLQVSPGERYLKVQNGGYNASLNIPRSYWIRSDAPISFVQDTILEDIVLPAQQVDVHVQDPAGTPVADARVDAVGTVNYELTMAGFPAYGRSLWSGATTDASGNATLWLFPTDPIRTDYCYTFNAYPPDGTPFAPFSLSGVTVTGDKSIIFVLQFVHAPPFTTATVTPSPDAQGFYPDPVTVTLSAVATPGFAVTETHYVVDGGSDQTYTAPFVVSGEGTHTIEYWSIDDAGVFEVPKTLTIEIGSNQPPTVSAGGPYSVGEGESVTVTASGTDPNNDPLTYAWDLDNDGDFETPGQSVTSSAADLDGPSSSTIMVQVTDPDAMTATDQATVNVLNVAPTAGFAVSAGTIVEGESATLEFSDQFDPGVDDSVAGFSYSYDCTGDGDFELADATTASFVCAYPDDGNFTARGRIKDKDGGYNEYTATIVVLDSGTDLALQASDITFTPEHPAVGESVTIQAAISYRGLLSASNVQVSFHDVGTLIGQTTIPTMSPGEIAEVSIQATYPESSLQLITVKADPEDAIPELDEGNNEASQLLPVGESDVSDAVMVVQASPISACQGEAMSVSGRADYVLSTVLGEQDFPVQGGAVTVKVVDPATANILGLFTGSHTNVAGFFSQSILAPGADGTYTLVVEVTDVTINGEIQTTLEVSGACPSTQPTLPPDDPTSPPSQNTPPDAVQDVYLFSEDIQFTEENPDKGETISVYANVHYFGSEPVFSIPVTVYDIFPVDGVLRTYEIGRGVVSYPDPENCSTRIVAVSWTNSQNGAHIIQVVVEPAFPQSTANDKATRSIFVGSPPQVDIDKSFTLLIDADEDGSPSPGDTLRYTIIYENQGTVDITGAVIIDDFDETLLETPLNLSDGGVISDGTITWNLGTIQAGASGSVTYEVNIVPQGEFPTGFTVIDNTALLSSDQTAPVAATARVEVVVNVPPTVDAGGPYSVDEGGSVTVTAFGDDFYGDLLSYAWDLDNDGTFETFGQTVIFSAAALDGPSTHTIVVQVTDDGGLSAISQATVDVLNVAPSVGAITTTTDPVQLNTEISTSADFTDPGVLDTHTAVWDWDDDTTSVGVVNEMDGSGSVTGSHTYAEPGVYTVELTVTDDDGGTGQSVFQFIIVYDPDGGFVSGRGWFNSPAGAYTPNDQLTGRATFGFVSKYERRAVVPEGETEFHFVAASFFKFHSDTYEWLVVGPEYRARYQGTGTVWVNGEEQGSYSFRLTAIDGDLDGTGEDKFRIRIWGSSGVIYDNEITAGDYDDPTTVIEDGGVIVHTTEWATK